MSVVNPIGASSGLTPMIVVTAPTGSTVTCDSIQGTEVSGTWTFKVAIGTHTIVASLNGQTKTESVLVDKVGLFEVELKYTPQTTYLYYLGDECTDLTGGWATSGYSMSGWSMTGSITKNSTNISLSSGGSAGRCGTVNEIDFGENIGFAFSIVTNNLTSYAYSMARDCETKSAIGEQTLPIYTLPSSSKKTGIFNTPFNFNNRMYMNFVTVYSSIIAINGCAIYRQDDIGGLSAYGSTISAILTNSSSLLANESAVRTMLTCTGDFMWSALANSTWISAYNSSAYKSLINSNADWSKALALL